MSNLSAESAKARPPSRAYTLGAAAAIGLSVMLGSVSAIAQTGTVDRGANRFDSVGIFGARTGLQLTRDNGTLAVDDPGVGGGFTLNKSLVDSYFLTLDFEVSELDNTAFNGTPFEVNRLRAGFGAHSREDRRWIGFWRFEYQAIQYFPTPPNGDRETEDGYGAHGGVIFKASPWLDLWTSAGFMGLDEMTGAEVSGGVTIPVTRRISLEASTRYTYLEDNDNDEFELFSTRGSLIYRFGGPSLARMVLGDRIVRRPTSVERTQSPSMNAATSPDSGSAPGEADTKPAPVAQPAATAPAAPAKPAASAMSPPAEEAAPDDEADASPMSNDEKPQVARPSNRESRRTAGPRRRR